MTPDRLTAAGLLDHARAAARRDERRHAVARIGSATSQHNEQTLRGWGSAALLDLEWASHYVYSKADKTAYRAAYATEYHRRRTDRSGSPRC